MNNPSFYREHTVKPAQFARTPVFKIPRVKEVYVIESAGLYKVGVSWSAAGRLVQIRSNLPTAAKLVKSVKVPAGSAYEAEAHAHQILAAYNVRGEWFRCTVEQACDAIDGAAAIYQAPESAHLRLLPDPPKE